MKFHFITSVAAVLLSSGHGVFAAKESVRQNCQKEDNRSACARRLPCVWVEMEGDAGGWATQSCCESTDVECILGYYLKDLIPTPPAPAPTPRRPSRSKCVKLGEDAVNMAIIPMCQLVASFPWEDNSQLMDCRDIATQTCKNKLADKVMQSCGVNTNRQEVRRACTTAVNDLLGSAAVTEDYEVDPYEEEKFDYSYLSEGNKMDPYGEDFDSSTSEDVEMESYDEDFYAVNKNRRQRANKMRRKAANKMRRKAANKMQGPNKKLAGNKDTVIKIGGNAKNVPMVNGKCPSGCTKFAASCMCPADSYLSEDNKMDPYGEDFDSSTSEDVEMESYDEDFYAVY